LGEFSVKREGALLGWSNAKTKALFQILIGERGRYFSKDQLIERLWPETEDLGTAASNLRGRVRELRRLLEPDLLKGSKSRYILTRREGYCFNSEADCWVDVEEFAHCLQDGERLLQAGYLGEALTAFEQALQLYRGDYLPDVLYEEWALERRAHWRQEHLLALERSAELHAQLGRLSEARTRCRQLLEREPYRESTWLLLMRLHAAAGERAEALCAYERCCEVLQEELGVDPSPALQAFYEDLKQGRSLIEFETAPKPSEPKPEIPRLEELPLVGRDKECHRLLERLQQTWADRGGLLLIMGEAGVGKTRLVQEALTRLNRAEWQVLTGRCPPLETPPALLALTEAIRAGLEEGALSVQALKGFPSAWGAELAELVPELTAHLPEIQALPALAPELRRLRLFEALSQFFLKLAAEKPLVLFLDDLHAADSSTLDWLKLFLPRVAKTPLLVLATARAEEAGEVLSTLQEEGRRSGGLHELFVERLTSGAVEELAQALSPQPELARLLYGQTRGNPFFITALLGLLAEQGLLRLNPEEGRWSLTATPAESEELLAPEVRAFLRRRLRRLDPREHELLYLTSVFGVSVPIAQLWEAWGSQDFAILEELIGKGFLVEQKRGEELAFVHELLREVAYAEMSAARRRAFHGRIVHILQALDAEPALLFHHCARSDSPAEAVEPGLEALDQARRSYQNAEALEVSDRLLELLEALPDLERKEDLLFEVRAQRFEIFGLLGIRAEQERELEEMAALADRLDDRRRVRVHRHRASWLEAAGRLDEALGEAQAALQLVSEDADQADCLLLLGNLSLDIGELVEAQRHYKEALRSYKACGDHRGRAQALNNLGIVSYYLADYEQCRSYYERALGLSRELRDLREAGKILNNLGDVYALQGEWDRAQDRLEESAKIRREIGDRRGEAITLANLGELRIRGGEPQAARAFLEQAAQLTTELQMPALEAAVRARLAWAHLNLGVTQSALAEAERAHALVAYGQAPEFAPEIYFRTFQVFEAAGRRDEASRALSKAYEELQRRADALPAPLRVRFLEDVLTHREIRAVWRKRRKYQI
jgi:predicted ATPase/DNA-binding SARP family transcriptional activator